MEILRPLALATALAAAAAVLPGCVAAQPEGLYGPGAYGGAGAYYGERDPYGVPGAWDAQLSPYGSWRYVAPYGQVWAPSVGPGWLPYQYGYWGWGPAGWVWFSDEPWGFTFHYGRWVYAPLGWVWVPGYTWGPAWVQWYWGAGYVGWAPLGWYGVVPWGHYVFVHDHDFGCRRVQKVIVHEPRVHYQDLYREGRLQRRPPPHDYIRRVSRGPMVRVSERRPPSTLAPTVRGNDRGRGRYGTPQRAGDLPPGRREPSRGYSTTPIPSRRPGDRAPSTWQSVPSGPGRGTTEPLIAPHRPSVSIPDRPGGTRPGGMWTPRQVPTPGSSRGAAPPVVVPAPASRPTPGARPQGGFSSRPAPAPSSEPAPPPAGRPGMSSSPFGQPPGGFLQPAPSPPAGGSFNRGFMGGGRGGGSHGGSGSPGSR